MDEEKIELADIEKMLGIKIAAAKLSNGEKRIRIAFANGAKMTVVMSDEGKWQNAASFAAENGSLLTEHIVVLHGSMEVATKEWAGGRPGGWPRVRSYSIGSVASIDARDTHATHPVAGSVVVGLMSSDWQGVTRSADPEFDATLQQVVGG